MFFRTCTRLNRLVCDRKLWTNFDFSTVEQCSKQILNKMKTYLRTNTKTKEFKIKGLIGKYPHDSWKDNTVTEKMLQELKERCPKLTTLAIYDAYLNFEHVN